MPVEFQLTRIVINEMNDQHIIFLSEVDGERGFPILIGIYEAVNINGRVFGYHTPRPMPYDFVISAIKQLGAEFHSIEIAKLEECTFYANVKVIQDGELLSIDARPSDAVALAYTFQPPLPIYVSEEVMAELLE